MKKFSKYFIWFYMLTKRLLFQRSFLILLCLIPCCMFFINLSFTRESGIVHIVLCSEAPDKTSDEIIRTLKESDTVIQFSLSDSEENAKKMVSSHKADAAWIFDADFSEKIDAYTKESFDREPLIKIMEREETIPLKIAKEKLFGATFKHISFSLYENFVYENLGTEKEISPCTAKKYYDSVQKGNEIVRIERLNATPQQKQNNSNYLTAPLRGILALMIVLCSLTAAMYFLKEQAQGKFSWLPAKKRIIPAIASCFGAAILSAIAVFFTLQFSGIFTSFGKELIAILLFIVSVTGFCTTLLTLFRSAGKFGALIPGIMIVMFVLSPIFFNLKLLRPIRLMLPTYYYLQSIYNAKYFVYALLYCITVYLLGFILNYVLAERKHGDTRLS